MSVPSRPDSKFPFKPTGLQIRYALAGSVFIGSIAYAMGSEPESFPANLEGISRAGFYGMLNLSFTCAGVAMGMCIMPVLAVGSFIAGYDLADKKVDRMIDFCALAGGMLALGYGAPNLKDAAKNTHIPFTQNTPTLFQHSYENATNDPHKDHNTVHYLDFVDPPQDPVEEAPLQPASATPSL